MNFYLKIFSCFCILNLIIVTFKGNENGIRTLNHNRIIRDVLFINGYYYKNFTHPYRYRILHQIEQLEAGNLKCLELYYLDLNPLIVLDFHIIIFYRCPWTLSANKAIEFAKTLNKKVLFDIDDLVIDTKYTNLISYLKTFSDSKKQLYDDDVTIVWEKL
jgi:hypothetical protein